jgi:hypothetical protein
VLAATLIIDAQLSKLILKPSRFGIFLCGGLPFDVEALKNNMVVQWSRKMEGAPSIQIPTVNCWAKTDMDYPGMVGPLSQHCALVDNMQVIHSAGHGVPSEGADLDSLVAAVTTILRRVET